MAVVHLRNGRADRHPRTFGDGAAWCGKKLLGKPEASEGGIDTFLVYGSEVRVTFDPVQGTCERCRAAFDAAYYAAFPNGPEPLATFRSDNPEDMERAKAALSPEALNRFFGPGGVGMAAFKAALIGSPTPEAGESV